MGGLGRGRARVTRGVVMSAACLLVPVAAHVAAGGAVPADASFLLVAALLSAACVALADRRRSAAEIAALLLVSQPVLHVVLSLAGHHDLGVGIAPGASMTLAHLAAAGVLTIVLAGAEATAWSLAALSATVMLRRARRLFALTDAVTFRPQPQRLSCDVAAPSIVRLHRSTRWRGPPALVSA